MLFPGLKSQHLYIQPYIQENLNEINSRTTQSLFGKDKIKPNQWELEFLTKLWMSYLNVGKFDKVTYKPREVLKKIIKKYRSKKEHLAQQRTK